MGNKGCEVSRWRFEQHTNEWRREVVLHNGARLGAGQARSQRADTAHGSPWHIISLFAFPRLPISPTDPLAPSRFPTAPFSRGRVVCVPKGRALTPGRRRRRDVSATSTQRHRHPGHSRRRGRHHLAQAKRETPSDVQRRVFFPGPSPGVFRWSVRTTLAKPMPILPRTLGNCFSME